MKQAQMMHLVPQKLREIEKEYGIRIVYAAESGSRAWGTNSAASDFDVRFIYIRPREDYLRLDPLRDVLEFPIADGWDMCGPDLNDCGRKANSSGNDSFRNPAKRREMKYATPITISCTYLLSHEADIIGGQMIK